MQKILIIGSPGSGKSTFGRRLHRITGIPLVHLDLLFHRADRTTCPPEEFDAKLAESMRQDAWIIDGCYTRTLDMRLAVCDTLFFFDLPAGLCLEGARARIGKPREDMPWVETELDEEFLQYILAFPQEQLPVIKKRLQEEQEKRQQDAFQVHTFHTREEATQFLDALEREGNQ